MTRRPAFTAAEKALCAKREANLRQRVYSRQVAQGRMTAARAKREIALMSEIAVDYQARARTEDAPEDLLA